MKIPVKELGKVFINSIFPFFEKSRALELIKKDALEAKEDLLAKLYDKVKPVFVTDDRKPILEQLHQKPNDKIWQDAASAVIKDELKKNKEFHKQLAEYVKELEKTYPSEIINEIYEIEGKKNTIEQEQSNGYYHKEINVRELPVGTYIYTLIIGNEKHQGKFLKIE